MKASKKFTELSATQTPGTVEQVYTHTYEVAANGQAIECDSLKQAEQVANETKGLIWMALEEDGYKTYISSLI